MEIKEREILIKAIVKPEFSGINAHSKTTHTYEGAQLGKNGYKTGLTSKEEEEFEIELGLPKGTLNKRNAKFWSNLPITLNRDKATHFNISSALDEIKYRTLLERTQIANTEMDIKNNSYAMFYIEDVEAKAKIEELTMDKLFEAVEEFGKMTADDRRGYLRLYGKQGVDNLSDIVVKTSLYKEVNSNPEKFLELVRDPDINTRISIEDLIEKGMIKKKGQYYKYEDEVIGNSVDAVVAFFKDMKNQSLKITMEAESKKANKKSK